jgi:cytoskeletal protein CcmA (bactofilin family)
MSQPFDSSSATDPKSFLSGLKDEPVTPVDEQPSFADRIEESLSKDKSVIGKNIKFRGELIGTEDLHIEGRVEGTVLMEGQNLSIGKEGEINANVHAQTIIINGKLTGDVLADDIIEIRSSAIVKGNLIAPRIQLDDGGKFRGSMDMIDTDQEKKDLHGEFKAKLVHPHLPNPGESIVSKKEVLLPKVEDTSKKK